MTRQIEMKTDKKSRKKLLEKVDLLTLFSFFISLIFIVIAFRQFNLTIIDYKIPIAIALTSGITFGLLTKRYFLNILTYQNAYGHLFLSIWTIGSLFTATFFLTNFLSSTDETFIKKARIVDSFGRRNGGFYVKIQLDDFEKTLTFSESKVTIDTSKYVNLELSHGGIGFDIIKKSTLWGN